MKGGSFWSDKVVFLTGHTGFKGSWLAMVLHALGAHVHGYALPPEDGGLYQVAQVGAMMTSSVYADLTDRAALDEAMRLSAAEIVIHMAAQPLVRLSYVDPVGTYMTNVMGTVHVLDSLRRHPGIRAAICVTSDKCYENTGRVEGYCEDDPMGGFDPYSSSKGCAELVTSAFRRSYFRGGSCQVASVRAGNVIGGGDWGLDRLVPDLVRGLSAGISPIIRNPLAIRPWQHVLEAVSGYMRLAQKLYDSKEGAGQEPRFSGGWNFGPNSAAERTVIDVVQGVCNRWSSEAIWRVSSGDSLHEAQYLKLDSSKAFNALGWRQNWDFNQTLDATVSWYRSHYQGQNMNDFTMSQIMNYFEEAS